MRVHLVIIDPQVDFCDPNGALYVQNAENDMTRLADWILKNHGKLEKIHVTLDCHHFVDIAHPVFWKNSAGENPAPGTIIKADDVKNGMWTTTMAGNYKRAVEYVQALEKRGKYPLCIWPPHCLIGTPGNNIFPPLANALLEWEKGHNMVNKVTKGSNPWTEHYSAIQADVEDPRDPSTQLNRPLIDVLETADLILLAGEAGSHCLAYTVRDIADAFSDDKYIKKLQLITDATSPVVIPGILDCTQLQEDFIAEMTQRGMGLTDTTTCLA